MNNKQIAFLSVAIFAIAVDQTVKFIIDTTVQLNQNILLIKNILSLDKLYNSGAAFSILQNHTYLLILIALLAILSITGYVFNKASKFNLSEAISLGFIVGGATGNLIDRLFHNYVIDFIQFDFINFPVFNFADIFINIGVIILLISILILKNDK